MSSHARPDGALLCRIDSACDAFEADWRADRRPRPEDFLPRVEEADRPALLRELQLMEQELRAAAGQTTPAAAPSSLPPDAATAAPDVGPPGAERDALPRRAGRYEIEGIIARGGMGVVLRAFDPDVKRVLAVKTLPEGWRHRPGLEERLREEAQITGQLQHPGIPPVHQVGTLSDGRPYFAMKLIGGRTLDALLRERPFPAADLHRFLTIFEQMCLTLAYAHSRGVIHRDLKPLNVMVGDHGEVQVMDWGLAKVLRRPEAAPDETARPAPAVCTVRSDSADDDGLSVVMGVMGTPRYLAPEQARGEVGAVDERADVFGLGALLCAILTGEPPFGGTPAEAMRQAADGDVSGAVARLAACGADAELVALCKECMAPAPENRPRDAGAVAARVAAYQAAVQERMRKAERERDAADVRAREERKRRRVQMALVAALFVIVAVGGGGAWWARNERDARQAEGKQRREKAGAGVVQAMKAARLLLDQAKADALDDAGKFHDALAAADKAAELARSNEASDELRQEAADLVNEVRTEEEAANRDRRLLAALKEVRGPHEGPRFNKDDKGMGTVPVRPDATGQLVVATIAMAVPPESSADEQFAAAFRAWEIDIDAMPTATALARLKARPAAMVTETVAALDDWADERRRRGVPQEKWQRVADLAAALDGDSGSARGDLRALLARGRLARERALGALSVALRPVPVPFDAGIGEDRTRLRRLAAEVNTPTEPVLGLLTLARALREAGEDARAERLLKACVKGRPREVVFYDELAMLLESQRSPRWGEVLECYTAARALRADRAGGLTIALVRSGRVEEGLALYEWLAPQRKENALFPFYVGFALQGQGQYGEAEACFREAVRRKPDFPAAYINLGTALSLQDRWPEAELACREAVRLDPNLPEAHFSLGAVLMNQHRYGEAELAFGEALRLKPDYAEAHSNIGSLFYLRGRFKEAAAAYRRAVRARPDYAEAYSNLGETLNRLFRWRDEEAVCREAIRLDPDLAEAHLNLGVSLGQQGRPEEAESEFRDAIRLRPKHALAHINLGLALREQGRLRDALESMTRGRDLYDDFAARLSSAVLIGGCKRLIEAEGKLPAVLAGDAPLAAADRVEFATVCRYTRRYKAAARLYAEAFADRPYLANDLDRGHRYFAAASAVWAAAGQGEGAAHLPDKVPLMLRTQALGWLRSDLALRAKTADSDDDLTRQKASDRLQYWRRDDALGSVRDPAPLAKLSEAERAEWGRLWDDVAALLKKLDEKK